MTEHEQAKVARYDVVRNERVIATFANKQTALKFAERVGADEVRVRK